jgi:hypothetical protein
MSTFADRAVPANPSENACIDFVNSRFADHLGVQRDTDRLHCADWWTWFLDRYGLPIDLPAAPPLDQLKSLRRDLRRILEKWAAAGVLDRRDARRLDGWTSLSAARRAVRLTQIGVEMVLEPVDRDWTWAISSIAASAVELMAGAEPIRLKVCENPDCSWMYYDGTLNGSKRYCSATPCGTLMRVRRYRDK